MCSPSLTIDTLLRTACENKASDSQGLITLEEALSNSSHRDEFKLRIAGRRSTTDAAREEMEKASQVERFANR